MKRIWLISGAMVSCLVGAVVGACGSSTSTGTGAGGSTGTSQTTTSSSSGNTTTSSSGNTTTSSSGNTTTSSSGNTTTSSSGNTTTSSSSGTTSTSSSSGATSTSSSSGTTSSSSSSGTCQTDPTLHPADGGAIYCGFGADGGSLTCPTGQECCVGGSLGGGNFAPDDCETWNMACTNPVGGGLQVLCNQPADCTANGKPNNICCLMGSAPTQVAGCDAADLKASGGTGVQCVAGTTCGTGNTQLCLQQSDCPAGKTCKPFRWKIVQLGACL